MEVEVRSKPSPDVGATADVASSHDAQVPQNARRFVRQESLVASGGLALAAVMFVLVAGAAYWSADSSHEAGDAGFTFLAAVGGIGSTAMLALLFLYRSLRRRLSGLMAVRDALGDEGCDAVSLGEVPVRGYDRPVTVWQLG